MTFRLLAALLAAALLSAACAGTAASTTTATAAPTTSASPTTTFPPPTTPTTAAPTTTAPATTVAATTTAPVEAFAEPGSCELRSGLPDAVGLSWPRSDDRLRSTGTVNVAVLFADFADVAADRSPEEALALVSPGSEDFFAAVSYGRMNLVLHPHLEWLRLGRSTGYAEAIRSFDGHRDFIVQAVALADAAFDFSEIDEVVVMSTPNATEIASGPTWMGFDEFGGRIDADGAGITNGITGGADITYWGWKWLPHEMGHSLGLPDLYDLVGGGFTRPFGIMDLIDSSAPGYFAYERRYLGWLDDDQIICLDGDHQATISPIETAGGVKAMMVPLSPSRAVAVESRRAIGYDSALSVEGALVYVVDASIPTFEGPIQVMNLHRRPLGVGESVTVEGVTITVVDATPDGDTVQITLDG